MARIGRHTNHYRPFYTITLFFMRYFSGLKPTGKPHLGNYFGMLKPLVDSQSEQNETYAFIPDYHALTSVTDGDSLRNMTWDCVETALAIGLTRPNTRLYLQSQFPEVQELTWYLSARATVSELERSHAYKDAIANGKTPNHALFAYPVLMAADILLIGAQIVPIGKDQKQHVEFARDWAQSFHRVYGETFVIPEPQISESVGVVMGTDGRKMSKSYGNVIGIFDNEATVKKAIMGIVTDSKGVEEPKDPETCNVFAIYKLMATIEEQEAMRKRYLA